jgi:hypothetical protein
MTWTRWSPCPPQFVHRRAVQGVKPTGDRATTIFDLRADRKHVAVYPATVDTFAMLTDRAGVALLVAAIESGNSCAVPGIHAVHDRQLLGLRPYGGPYTGRSQTGLLPDMFLNRGPMELYVHLPDAQIHIIYGCDRLPALHDSLTQLIRLMR